MYRILIICSFFLISNISADSFPLKYGLFAKKTGDVPITKYAILSERCSGSNFIEVLIKQNFEITNAKFCHKHFLPWYELPIEDYFGDPKHYTFEGTDDHLFIVIFRDPYDWVRSFHKIPHHALISLKKMPFSQFIRAPWELNPNENEVVKLMARNPLMDRNPIDGSLFNNVLQLRTAKTRNYLLVKDRAKNVYYINYEKARDYPQEVLKEIEKIFGLNALPEYTPVIYYYGKKGMGIYKKKDYSPLSQEDRQYINSELDRKLERKIGYKLI